MEVLNKIELKDLYDDIETIENKFIQLPINRRVEIINKTAELYALEPKRRGRPPTGFILRYKRLSIASKIKMTNYINKALEYESKMSTYYKKIEPKPVAMSNVIVIDFKRVAKRREERLLCDSFVAYETDWCFGVKGYLRHRFNCADKSKANFDKLIQDMEKSLQRVDSESIQISNKYRQYDDSKMLGTPMSQTVTEAQKRILQQILSTCESELFVDLCNDNTVRIENHWKACLIFRYNPKDGEISVTGNTLDVENYMAGRNVYF